MTRLCLPLYCTFVIRCDLTVSDACMTFKILLKNKTQSFPSGAPYINHSRKKRPSTRESLYFIRVTKVIQPYSYDSRNKTWSFIRNVTLVTAKSDRIVKRLKINYFILKVNTLKKVIYIFSVTHYSKYLSNIVIIIDSNFLKKQTTPIILTIFGNIKTY